METHENHPKPPTTNSAHCVDKAVSALGPRVQSRTLLRPQAPQDAGGQSSEA